MAMNMNTNRKGPTQAAPLQKGAAQAAPLQKGATQATPLQGVGATATMGSVARRLTHQQIAERARTIWKAKGCPVGRDERNWLEAEAQLKKEQGIR